MIYVIDFENGSHKSSHQLDNLIGNNTFQPIELECELDSVSEVDFIDYLKEIKDSDTIYVFIKNSDGPSSNTNSFRWIRENLNVDAYISSTI